MTTTITRRPARPSTSASRREASLLDALTEVSPSEDAGDDQTGATADTSGRVGSSQDLTLVGLFRAHRGSMFITYALFCIENALRLAQPLVLGLAINDLLTASYRGLLVFVGQHLAYMLIGAARQMYDTRVFTSVYAGLATDLISTQRSGDVDTSRVAARSTLSREYVDFFEQSMPMLLQAAFSIAGALLMLGWYSVTLIPLCLMLLLPAALLNAAYGRRTLLLSGRLHDEYEQEVSVIESGDPQQTRRHFDALSHWRVKLSDAEAINFALMELFVLGLIATTLVHFCTSGSVSPATGDIFAVFRYVLLFVVGLDAVPGLVQRFAKLRDISRRLV